MLLIIFLSALSTMVMQSLLPCSATINYLSISTVNNGYAVFIALFCNNQGRSLQFQSGQVAEKLLNYE